MKNFLGIFEESFSYLDKVSLLIPNSLAASINLYPALTLAALNVILAFPSPPRRHILNLSDFFGESM